MDRFPFYLDERVFVRDIAGFPNATQNLTSTLTLLESLGSFEVCELFCCEDFYSLDIDGQAIAQILFGEEGDGETRDLVLRLQIALDKFQVAEISDEDDLSHGAYSLKKRGYGGLVAISQEPEYDWWDDDSMLYASAMSEVKERLRKIFVLMGGGTDRLDKYAEILFPEIYFHAMPSKFKDIGLDYHQYFEKFVSHLSYLNDHAETDFFEGKEAREIIARAGGKGVEMSPESPQTHRNKAAMSERNITIDKEEMSCEWHTKLHPQKGRIHFFPWSPRTDGARKKVGKRVIVGIIVEHLT